MNATAQAAAAEVLARAEAGCLPVERVSERFPGLDVADSYEIQLRNVRLRDADAGGPRARAQGRAVLAGHAAHDARQRARLRPPAHPTCSSPRTRPSGPTRSARARVEVEMAFVLARAAAGAGAATWPMCCAAPTSFARPWRSSTAVSGTGTSTRSTPSPTTLRPAWSCSAGSRTPLDGLDLRTIGATLRFNNRLVATGATGAVAWQPGHCGRLAGQQGASVWCAT